MQAMVGGMREWKQVTFGNGHASQSHVPKREWKQVTFGKVTFDEICLSVEYMACRSAAEPEAAAVLPRAS